MADDERRPITGVYQAADPLEHLAERVAELRDMQRAQEPRIRAVEMELGVVRAEHRHVVQGLAEVKDGLGAVLTEVRARRTAEGDAERARRERDGWIIKALVGLITAVAGAVASFFMFRAKAG